MEFAGFIEMVEKEVVNKDGKKVKKQEKKATVNSRMIRHTYSTIMKNANVDDMITQYVMGHADFSTTANIYIDKQEPFLKQALVEVSRAFEDLATEKKDEVHGDKK